MPSTGYLTNQHNVLIECGSASSFELSPRFANHPFRERLSSQEQFHQDVENEIQEAMSDTIQGAAATEENNLDGKSSFFLKFYFLVGKSRSMCRM